MPGAVTRIVMNRDGVRAVLQSPGVLADVTARAERIAKAAGPGFEVTSQVGATRARASVRTGTDSARRAAAEGNALTAAIDAGR